MKNKKEDGKGQGMLLTNKNAHTKNEPQQALGLIVRKSALRAISKFKKKNACDK